MPVNLTDRGTNNDPYMNDGFSTTITFDLGFTFYEKEISPMGFSVKGIDTTGMRNVGQETEVPATLVKDDDIEATIAYKAADKAIIRAAVGVIQEAVVDHSDGSTDTVTGFLKSFKPNPHKPGEQPTARIVFTPGGEDEDGNEIAPTFG
jgi:hypothetical protein